MVQGAGNNLYYAYTRDGWKLGIKRYKPDKGNIAKYPVILCHGLAANKHSVDFGEEETEDWKRYSLAAYLYKGNENELKFDIWVPELRGRNMSKTFDPNKNLNKYRWSVEEYIDIDVPAIINRVQQQYQEEKDHTPPVLWVGKSMGGMLSYAYGIHHSDKLKGVVTMASPVRFTHSAEFIKLLVRICPRRISGPIRLLERLNWEGSLFEMLKNSMAKKENIERRILDQFLKQGFNNPISLKVINHFAIFVRNNTFCRYPRYPWVYDIFDRVSLLDKISYLKQLFAPYSYTDNLHKFRSPLLVIAGGGDSIAHPVDVKYAFNHVASNHKKYILFKKDAMDENGKKFSSHNYGHLDINLGITARDEVYPKIYEWLKEQAEH
jgi:pimeloyl-ACP methyl ester carboxylesterase